MTTAHEQGVVAESSATTPRKFPIGEYVFASVVIVLAIVVLIGAGMIRVPAGSSNVLGARAFPYGVGILLLLAGIAVFIGILRGKLGDPEGGEDIAADVPTSWFTVIKISACFLSLIVLIPLAGWPIAVTVLFAGASLSLGAKKWWRAILIGLIIGLLTQFGFAHLLGLSLPAGPLLGWIPFLNG